MDPNGIKQEQEEATKALATLVEPFISACNSTGVEHEVILVRGDPREALLEACLHHNVNLLVVGSRGLGTVRRALLGSVSTHMVHHAHCPVLVVPTAPR
mmetsp:Transcript_30702/g.70775  ORF Transcript_30702/g.70775 Transcript_30702/m.70775 type:complete len:99 (+) Transcript_30702:229-525(+)